MKTLEEILQEYFGCKGGAFQSTPVEYDENGYIAANSVFTEEGSKAYEKLTSLIYDLNSLDVINSRVTNNIVETLDDICRCSY